MFAITVITLFTLTGVLVSISLTDSALRARLAFRRLQFERLQSNSFAANVMVTVVRPRIEPATTVVALPSRKPAAIIRSLRPLAAAA